MAFNIILYKNNADKTTVDKSSQLITIGTMTGNLREESSIVRPTITIDVSGTSFGNPPTANYAYISVWNRYYYINNITSVRNNLWQLDMTVDVLMSFKNKILASSAYVARSKSASTLALMDNMYPQKCFDIHYIVNPSNNPEWYTTEATMYYYMQIIAGLYYKYDGAGSLVEDSCNFPLPVLGMPYTRMKSAFNVINSQTSWFGESTIKDFMSTVYALPFLGGHSSHKYISKIDVPGLNYLTFTDESSSTACFQMIDLYNYTSFQFDLTSYVNTANEYYNTPPYKQYMLEFQPFGTLTIPYSRFRETKTLYVHVKTNIITGDAAVYIGDDATFSHAEYITSANIAIKIPYGQTVTNMNSFGHLASLASLAGGIATQNYGMAVAGLSSEATNITNTLSPTATVAQGTNNFISTPRIIVAEQPPITGVTDLYGKPYYVYEQLSNLNGYCQVEKIHLEGFELATLDEIEEIESLLKGGVILPAASEV